jgi:methionyl-tRNA synthetase
LVNRVLVFAKNNCSSTVPAMGALEEADRAFLETVRSLVDEAYDCYSNFRLRRAAIAIMELAQRGNVYFDSKQPWKAAKDPDKRASMETTIACCLECLKSLALVSSPIIPETAEKVWSMIGFEKSLEEGGWKEAAEERIPEGQQLQQPVILFNKIEDEQIEEELLKLQEMSKKAVSQTVQGKYESLKESIAIDEVQKLDLRVAKVLAAEPVKSSNKLLKLEVDLGFEKRTILSGIKKHYDPGQLIGKNVVIVANLKPAKMMGIESQGMLLAGSSESDLEVLFVENLPPGSPVK